MRARPQHWGASTWRYVAYRDVQAYSLGTCNVIRARVGLGMGIEMYVAYRDVQAYSLGTCNVIRARVGLGMGIEMWHRVTIIPTVGVRFTDHKHKFDIHNIMLVLLIAAPRCSTGSRVLQWTFYTLTTDNVLSLLFARNHLLCLPFITSVLAYWSIYNYWRNDPRFVHLECMYSIIIRA